MRRFAQEELSKILELTQNGAGLREISSLLKRNKSSVQYHYAKIKGKQPRQKDLSIGNLSKLELGWLCGFYAGDGSRNFRKKTYSYEVKFALSIRECYIVEYVEKLLLKCDVRSWRCIDEKRVYVKCLNKTLYGFFEEFLKWEGTKKSNSVRLINPSSHGHDFLFGFLCGIIDADGGTKRLYISTSSEKLADNIREICTKLNIASKTSKCRKCRRPLTWGDRTYDFDHKDNNPANNSQTNCYLVCKVCHGKHTVVKKRRVTGLLGETIGHKTIKKKIGYKKPKKKAKKTRRIAVRGFFGEVTGYRTVKIRKPKTTKKVSKKA